MQRRSINLFECVALACLVLSLTTGLHADDTLTPLPSQQAKDDFFETKVRPLIIKRCVECHGEDDPEGNLRFDSAIGYATSTKNGAVIEPGDLKNSRLVQLIDGKDGEFMPPEDRLTADEITVFKQWVINGGNWPGYEDNPNVLAAVEFTKDQLEYWAFQPVITPEIPSYDAEWITNPIDAFIWRKLNAADLQPSSPVDDRTWLRRVTYDLTGLPPSISDIEAFESDKSDLAKLKVVNRLLSSTAYGERWGKHWLDIVRFGESAAHDGNNAYLHAWRYRDYVIDAINNDIPYDRFIIEQLAGDLLEPTGSPAYDIPKHIATGFLQVGPKPVVMRDKQQMLRDIADEQLHTTGVAFLGLTIGCARCHDHKFDPIPTADYYSLFGIFMNTHVMEDMLPDSKWIEPKLPDADGEMVTVMSVADLPTPEIKDIRIHRRGSYKSLGPEAPRRFLQIIEGPGHKPPNLSGSGRLELAKWIASYENPLTARVMVNRIWSKYFGHGIVRSLDDFGVRGDLPSHPELLDYLATEFMRNGWSWKHLHRQITLSSTYAQSAADNETAANVDPDNRLLWHKPRRRLDAEEIRDALLYTSQKLDPAVGGSTFTSGFTYNDPKRDLAVVAALNVDTYAPYLEPRRSVYMPVIRNRMHPVLSLFDTANEHESSPKRNETTVAPQTLFMINSPFVRKQGTELARHLTKSHPNSNTDRINAAYQTVFSRLPTHQEVTEAKAYLKAYVTELDPDGKLSEQFATWKEDDTETNEYEEAVLKSDGLLAFYDFKELTDGIVPNLASDKYGQLILKRDPIVDSVLKVDGESTRLETRPGDVQWLHPDSKQLSVEYWVRPESAKLGLIIGRDGGGVRIWKSGLYEVNINGKVQPVAFHEFFGGQGQGLFHAPNTPKAVLALKQWHHVVMTYGGGKRHLYVNGDLAHSLDVTADFLTGTAPLSIGSRSDDEEFFHGSIDNVAIYSRVLNSDEVTNHYQLHQKTKPQQSPQPVSPEFIAMVSLCHALICTNEFIYLD